MARKKKKGSFLSVALGLGLIGLGITLAPETLFLSTPIVLLGADLIRKGVK
jgi:hypothetical protein